MKKNLNKKIRKLEMRIKKDMKKLSKLKRKLAEKAGAKRKTKVNTEQTTATKKAATSRPPRRKRKLSPEARAKLASLMKARWEAKRRDAQSNAAAGDSPPPVVGNS